MKLKAKTGKKLTQECRKRSLVYETYCKTCEKEAIAKIESEENGNEKSIMERKRKMRYHKYIGETARSTYERAWEHISDRDQLSLPVICSSIFWMCMRAKTWMRLSLAYPSSNTQDQVLSAKSWNPA